MSPQTSIARSPNEKVHPRKRSRIMSLNRNGLDRRRPIRSRIIPYRDPASTTLGNTRTGSLLSGHAATRGEGEWRTTIKRPRRAGVEEQTGIQPFRGVLQVAARLTTNTRRFGVGRPSWPAPLKPRIPVRPTRRSLTVGWRSPTSGATQAERQLRGYLADGRLALLYPDTEFKGMVLVFRGWELAYGAEVLPESSAGPGLDRSPPTSTA